MESSETVSFDILFVGAGPATLSCVYKLMQLSEEYNQSNKNGKKINLENRICIIEKGSSVGSHTLSGALVEESELCQLLGVSVELLPFVIGRIKQDNVCFLTSKKSIRVPFSPPSMKNKNNFVISISKFCKYISEILEKNGIPIICGESADDLILKDKRVCGIKTFKKHVENNLEDENGLTIESMVTVLGEGSNGYLTERLLQDIDLTSKIPRTYELGIKELYERVDPLSYDGNDHCYHTIGYPLIQSGDSGGGFIYSTSKYVTIGLAAHLHTKNNDFNLHKHLQSYKEHPLVKNELKGTRLVEYGAKTMPCGSFSAHNKFVTDGALLIGDCAGLVDTMRLKGVGNAIGSGVIAAKALFNALVEENYSKDVLQSYENDLIKSNFFKRFKNADGFSQAISSTMPFPALPLVGLQAILGGKLIHKLVKTVPDYKRIRKIATNNKVDECWHSSNHFEKEKSVYYSNLIHTCLIKKHISIKDYGKCEKCRLLYGAPCRSFCPAGVYLLENNKISVSSDNCIHCRTCSLKCPFLNVNWEIPSGGVGPRYLNM